MKLRVFAGPNGSGKSTVIKYVRKYKVNSNLIDFGEYVNADDIAASLKENDFSFNQFHITVFGEEFRDVALASGLVNASFDQNVFNASFQIQDNSIKLLNVHSVEALAQIIADFLRKKLLEERRKFSFETVFSHESKLDIMKQAKSKGYKVYLYFVSTESPEINKARVASRVAQGGHDVPIDKIESRYYRSLNFLYDSCQIADQVFFFDNSLDTSAERDNSNMFSHFKLENGKKKWDEINELKVPHWFIKYYSEKINRV